jgi:hypothetical protein
MTRAMPKTPVVRLLVGCAIVAAAAAARAATPDAARAGTVEVSAALDLTAMPAWGTTCPCASASPIARASGSRTSA